MEKPYFAATDIAVLPSYFPIPGLGFLQCNAYVIKANEPVLVDTGLGIDCEEFMRALKSVIDPQDLKWILITHDDADHIGNFETVISAAPEARIATNAVTVLRMSTWIQIPMDRVYCLNPGESISVGDRKLTAFKPPFFDNPATIGFYDDKSEAVYSADFFGAILPSPVKNIDEVSEETLAQGMVLWGTVDSPWLHFTDQSKFRLRLDAMRKMAPKMIFSSHLPPAYGRTEQFLRSLASVPEAEPFTAPNQAAFQQLLAEVHSI
ncbi:MAG TPA: MBL fold metallo-hydrolase [Armatimonadota bacterium]|nr:MBL fold metallo-hydrolase [Armatimonadota bacterium]